MKTQLSEKNRLVEVVVLKMVGNRGYLEVVEALDGIIILLWFQVKLTL